MRNIYLTLTWRQAKTLLFLLLDYRSLVLPKTENDIDLDMIITKIKTEME